MDNPTINKHSVLILQFALPVLGFLLVMMLRDIRKNIEKQWERIDEMKEKLTTLEAEHSMRKKCK